MFFALLLIGWLKALWIVNINASEISIPLSLFMLLMKDEVSYTDDFFNHTCAPMRVLINKLNLTLTWSSSLDLSFFFFLGVTEAKVTELHGGYKGFYFVR